MKQETVMCIPVALITETEPEHAATTQVVVVTIRCLAETISGLSLLIPDGFPVLICMTEEQIAVTKRKAMTAIANKKSQGFRLGFFI